jgi:hypothetical protein
MFYDPELEYSFAEDFTNAEIRDANDRGIIKVEFVEVVGDDEVIEAADESLEFSELDIKTAVEAEMVIITTDRKGNPVVRAKPERELRVDVANKLYALLKSKGRDLFVDQVGRFQYHDPKSHKLINFCALASIEFRV